MKPIDVLFLVFSIMLFMFLLLYLAIILVHFAKKENQLNKCGSCGRLYRGWQNDMHHALYQEDVCVHCGERSHRARELEDYEVEPFMKKDPDCVRLNIWSLFKINYQIYKLDECRKKRITEERKEKYEALRELSYWQKKAINKKFDDSNE